jgi:hypothetical protein
MDSKKSLSLMRKSWVEDDMRPCDYITIFK